MTGFVDALVRLTLNVTFPVAGASSYSNRASYVANPLTHGVNLKFNSGLIRGVPPAAYLPEPAFATVTALSATPAEEVMM